MSEINKARAKKIAGSLKMAGLDNELECMLTGRKTTMREDIERSVYRSLNAQQAARTRKANRHRHTLDMFNDHQSLEDDNGR